MKPGKLRCSVESTSGAGVVCYLAGRYRKAFNYAYLRCHALLANRFCRRIKTRLSGIDGWCLFLGRRMQQEPGVWTASVGKGVVAALLKSGLVGMVSNGEVVDNQCMTSENMLP